jgi:hypothetical protein
LPSRFPIAAAVATGVLWGIIACQPQDVRLSGTGSSYGVDFGPVAIGAQASVTVSLKNPGSSPLQISAVGAPTDPEFSTEVLSGDTIPAGGTLAATVGFKPFNPGQKTASIRLQTNSTDTPSILLNLGGQGVDVQLTVAPTNLDFGNVVIGSSETKQVTLSNGSTVDLTVTPGPIGGVPSGLFSIDQPGPFTLPPMGQALLSATYQPQAPSTQDVAGLDLALSLGGSVHLTFRGSALQNGLRISPSPLDFGFVQVGASTTRPLELSNQGNQPITVSSVVVSNPGSPPAFAITPSSFTPVLIPPGGSKVVDVVVDFAPPSTAQYLGELDVSSTDSHDTVPVALNGFGGGAAITCTPSSLEFGPVAAGTQAVQHMTCTNTGSNVPGHPEAGLTITSLTSSNSLFTAAVSAADSAAQPLPAGQLIHLDVMYTPQVAGSNTALLKIGSNVTDGTSVPVPVITLSGESIEESFCTYSVTPQALDFGRVPIGAKMTSGFSINNLGPNECLVTGLGLGSGSESAFTLRSGTPTSQRLSPPGVGGPYPSSLQVGVVFSPQQTGDYSGTAQFTISDPQAPQRTLSLSGEGTGDCFLLSPLNLDFRTVGLGGGLGGTHCPDQSLAFVGVNGCQQAVTIQSLWLEAGSGAFSLSSITVPQTVAPGESSAPFNVAFNPQQAGTYFGSALVQTDFATTPYGVGFGGAAVVGNSLVDAFNGTTPQIDVLWVMDTDDDDAERTLVASEAPTIISGLSSRNLDYQIGVTTTDDCEPATGTAENGRILPCPGCKVKGQLPTIITSSDSNAASDLQTLMAIGSVTNSCYPDEQLLGSTYAAVAASPRPSWNAGLVRPGAYLAVIVVQSDGEDDNSRTQDPQWFANQFLTIKGADHPELFSWSYISPTSYGAPGGHTPFDRLPQRIAETLSRVGGVAIDTGQDNWWLAMSDLWNAALLANDLHLSGKPDPATIAVYLDGPPPSATPPGQTSGLLIPQTDSSGNANWTYDSAANAVDINGNVLSVSSYDTIYVQYTLTCP